MFPPPTTAATCTPSSTTATISRAMRWTTLGEMPSGSSPEKASPDSLTTTRRHGVCTQSAGGAGSLPVAVSPPSTVAWPLLVGAAPAPTAGPVTCAAPSSLSALFSTRRPPLVSLRCRPSACLADLESRKRLDHDALLAEQLLDRLL